MKMDKKKEAEQVQVAEKEERVEVPKEKHLGDSVRKEETAKDQHGSNEEMTI